MSTSSAPLVSEARRRAHRLVAVLASLSIVVTPALVANVAEATISSGTPAVTQLPSAPTSVRPNVLKSDSLIQAF